VQTDVPGLKVEQFLSTQDLKACPPAPPANEYVPDPRCVQWTSGPAIDAAGSLYFATGTVEVSLQPKLSAVWRTRRDGSMERVAHVDPRKLASGAWARGSLDGLAIDPFRGYLYVLLRTACVPTLPDQECRGGGTGEVVRITGLPISKVSRGNSGG
jgi:hypothetical protein